MDFIIEAYETENGNKPMDEFLASLDKAHRMKVYSNISRLESRGNLLRMPLSRPLEDGIFELRTQYKDGISRVCYFFFYGRKIILTHGFIKKTEKTPDEEIKKAIRYKNDYIRRYGGKK
ncbi:MAG: type II toxin-antitoxin system RelE/ParE family toxin [Flexilinea sp.]|nr:type II toxin-antitoxin system RelE/ParE family toxin [Flexilinea sp.]